MLPPRQRHDLPLSERELPKGAGDLDDMRLR